MKVNFCPLAALVTLLPHVSGISSRQLLTQGSKALIRVPLKLHLKEWSVLFLVRFRGRR